MASMSIRSPSQRAHGLILAAGVAPVACWLLATQLTRDLWYDELYTLSQFVCVPLRQTVTSYVAPNNHVCFSLIANVYRRALGLESVGAAMDAVWQLRLLNLLPTIGTLVYVHELARKHLSMQTARLAVLLLATTIPFLNFALQFRGYVWSMFFLCGMLHALWTAEQDRRWRPLAAAAAFAVLALYTIPLNLYFVLSVMLVYAAVAVRRRDPAMVRPVAALGLAIIVGALLYAPVMAQLLADPVVQSRGPFAVDTLARVMPRTLLYFVSERYLLMAFAGLALALGRRVGGQTVEAHRYRGCFCLALLVLPFVLSFLRGDRPFLRVFVNLTPVFALLLAIAVSRAGTGLAAGPRRARTAAVCLVVYCCACLGCGLWRISVRLRRDIAEGRKSQDIYYNYYQAHYEPARTASLLASEVASAPGPVVCYFPGDKLAAAYYLAKYGIEGYRQEMLDRALDDTDCVYVLTAFPERFRAALRTRHPRCHARLLGEPPSFLNAYRLTSQAP